MNAACLSSAGGAEVAMILPPPLWGRAGEGGMPHREVTRIQRSRAKQLRRAMTRAETLLWRHLKAHRLAALGSAGRSCMGAYSWLASAMKSTTSFERLTPAENALVGVPRRGWSIIS